MKMNKRIIAFLLLASMMSAALISCSETTSGDETTQTSQSTPAGETASSADVETETEEIVLSDMLVEKSYGGATFNISTFQNGNFHYEVDAEEMTAIPINDAIWERNTLIEEKYDIVIEQVINGDGANTGTIRTAITAGDGTVPLSIVRCGTDLAFWKENLTYT